MKVKITYRNGMIQEYSDEKLSVDKGYKASNPTFVEARLEINDVSKGLWLHGSCFDTSFTTPGGEWHSGVNTSMRDGFEHCLLTVEELEDVVLVECDEETILRKVGEHGFVNYMKLKGFCLEHGIEEPFDEMGNFGFRILDASKVTSTFEEAKKLLGSDVEAEYACGIPAEYAESMSLNLEFARTGGDVDDDVGEPAVDEKLDCPTPDEPEPDDEFDGLDDEPSDFEDDFE